jgi:hypothetical protein
LLSCLQEEVARLRQVVADVSQDHITIVEALRAQVKSQRPVAAAKSPEAASKRKEEVDDEVTTRGLALNKIG